MRGSIQASRMSENSVPMTVSVLRSSRKLPARYMSCDIRARSIIGPVVCRLSTAATSVEPEIRLARDQPTVLKKGFSATRTGYFQSSLPSLTPLARAVLT